MAQFIQLEINDSIEFIPSALITRAVYHPDSSILELNITDHTNNNCSRHESLDGEIAQHVLKQLNAAMVVPDSSKLKTLSTVRKGKF